MPARPLPVLLTAVVFGARALAAGPHPTPARTDPHGDPLPPGAIARLGTVRLRHGAPVAALAFSPDGKTLASCGRDPVVCLWDAATGKLLRELRGPRSGADSLAFSPDGKVLAWMSRAGNDPIILLDVTTGRQLLSLEHQGTKPECVAFSPDGKALASGGWSGEVPTLWLWAADTGKVRWRVRAHHEWLHAVAFSPDRKTLASVGQDRTVRLWGTASGKEVRRLRWPEDVPWHAAWGEGKPRALSFSPDGRTLTGVGMWSGAKGVTILAVTWDLATGKERARSTARADVFAFFPGGKSLATLDRKAGALRVWDTGTGKERRRLRGPRPEAVGPNVWEAAAITPDGKVLAVADGPVVRLWDLSAGRELLPPAGHRGGVETVAVVEGGKTLASSGSDHTVRLWDLATGKERRRLPGGERLYDRVLFSPEAGVLALCRADGTIDLRDTRTGRRLRTLTGRRWAHAAAFSPDGSVLAAVSREQPARLWDVRSGKELRRLEYRSDPGFDGVAFSPDGRALATGEDGALRLWEAASGRELTAWKRPAEAVPSPAFSPDGRLVGAVFGTYGAKFRLFERSSGEECWTFDAEPGGFQSWCESFSPAGRFLALGREDGSVWLCDLARGPHVRRLAGHRGPVNSVAFSPDGRRLFSGSEDTTVLVWDVAALARAAPVTLKREELEARWRDLGGPDAARACAACWSLGADPRHAAPFLRARLRSARRATPQQIARLIRALDDESFEERERATAELRRLEKEAEPALRRALADHPSPEARRRLTRLLEPLNRATPDLERLRALRAVAALEQGGTAEALRVLGELSKREEDWLAREAKASRARLAARLRGKP